MGGVGGDPATRYGLRTLEGEGRGCRRDELKVEERVSRPARQTPRLNDWLYATAVVFRGRVSAHTLALLWQSCGGKGVTAGGNVDIGSGAWVARTGGR